MGSGGVVTWSREGPIDLIVRAASLSTSKPHLPKGSLRKHTKEVKWARDPQDVRTLPNEFTPGLGQITSPLQFGFQGLPTSQGSL